jgi:2-C-methyl-D-erythritol 4-phosphate cytidylyltransferase
MSATMGETTVLEASVDRLREALPGVPVIVVVRPSEIERWRTELAVDGVIAGGERRQDSVRIGVDAILGLGPDTVVIHDGARPIVHGDDVRATVGAIEGADGAILCGPVPDTVKRVSNNGAVIETIDRDRLRLAQTPQVFRVAALEEAWAACDFDRVWSDEAAVVEAAGRTVRAVAAGHPNPKITTAADLELVRALIGEES